jgi:hypothetical protein
VLFLEKHVNVREAFAILGFLASVATPACSSTEGDGAPKVNPSTGASATIGPAGGQLVTGEVELDVPPGALPSPVTLSVSQSASAAPRGYKLVSPIFEFSPAGTVFASPVTVNIHASGGELSASVY